ncbi:hypothetical protein FHR83_006781 [Actinoplanes campanulatus]|uniref:Uncharacterized protein n=1 Tax=Actinoplanes campanulatus TaxID=113559 RepID=A0A7W5AMW9_9ACTN|nr:hypothetical protein [Actinoplanes campanulatus]MBB3099075.1 hypothetical protein [Actinoplanes campanulatus]GGN39152.1 hypothetical protein GCM10010109_66770 [Actinoplanes campanulatus]GID40232.1 hypothetical protein Aca09nite_67380 [Actinoplanes campanulatus]
MAAQHMVTEHAVCALPGDHRDWRHLVIRVQRRGATDRWLVTWGAYYLTADGDWYPSMSRAVEYDEDEALIAADMVSKTVDVNGLTAADLLNR